MASAIQWSSGFRNYWLLTVQASTFLVTGLAHVMISQDVTAHVTNASKSLNLLHPRFGKNDQWPIRLPWPSQQNVHVVYTTYGYSSNLEHLGTAAKKPCLDQLDIHGNRKPVRSSLRSPLSLSIRPAMSHLANQYDLLLSKWRIQHDVREKPGSFGMKWSYYRRQNL